MYIGHYEKASHACQHYTMQQLTTFEHSRLDGIIAPMKLSNLGEFRLIDLIKDAVEPTYKLPSETARRVIIGIGDDTAAWRGSDLIQLATTDSLIENTHFAFDWCTWEDLGHKSLAVNLSDIAAMGGRALYALVSLSCPSDVDSEAILSYYRGMTTLALQHGVAIIGGNLATSPIVTSTVLVHGDSPRGRLLRRSTAQPGDVIAVTGTLGTAAAALARLRDGTTPLHRVPQALLTGLVRPQARLAEGQLLVEEGVECAIDISDGLLSDIGHICECSNVSATVCAALLPISTECRDASDDPIRLALTGGEVYELLFTCKPATLDMVAGRLECPVTAIGEIGVRTDSPVVVVLGHDNRPLGTPDRGWNHFRE